MTFKSVLTTAFKTVSVAGAVVTGESVSATLQSAQDAIDVYTTKFSALLGTKKAA